MKLCQVESTRKAHMTAFESRNRENIELLEEALKLRRSCAKVSHDNGIGAIQT